jgi:hypothetical protein
MDQLRVLSTQRIRLRNLLSDSPILELLWQEVGEEIVRSFPPGNIVLRFGRLVNRIDPQGERFLTSAVSRLKEWGIDLSKSDRTVLEWIPDEVQGHTFELEYLNGFGISRIRTVEGSMRAGDDLRALAGGLGPLVDARLFPNLNRQPGESWSVSAADWGGLLGLSSFMDTSGSIDLRLGQDGTYQQRRVRRAAVTGGEVRLAMSEGGRTRETVLRPQTGTVDFDTQDLLVRRAVGEWQIEALEVSENHLLFGSRREGTFQVQSRYEGWPIR